ncbi:hypothetical protein V5799_000981 [Amblyomma americanum]|uniref:Integral to membrane n=1 Tax=Amblyomma americanum TaxID=6943 RepID=A0AAQ4D1I5_AMBAM
MCRQYCLQYELILQFFLLLPDRSEQFGDLPCADDVTLPGLGYLLRYLLAVAHLTYRVRRKALRFVHTNAEKSDDIISSGAVCSPVEWTCECPQKRELLNKYEDSVLFYGVNSGGDKLVVSVRRLPNQLAELWLALYAPDGTTFTLPAALTLDRSAGSCFSAAGLRLHCLAPNRRWRVAYNGLLRKHSESGAAESEESEVHVKFGFIWSAGSHTLEQPAELVPQLLAESLAELPFWDMVREIDKLLAELDTYDQAGIMSGELTVAGKTREFSLWGYKVRTQGANLDGTYEQDHHFGFLENGDMYHLVHSDEYGRPSGVLYGSIYLPSSKMLPIDYALLRTGDLPDALSGRLHVGCGSVCLPVCVKYATPSLVFKSEDSSCEVDVAAVNLKCEDNAGSGFRITVRRRGRTVCHVADHFKHKIIQDHELPAVAPLVSDIQDAHSKVPDLTGGKGSSLAVLHSIATQLKTFSVPPGFIVTTRSYELFASCEGFRKLVKQIEVSRARNDSQAALKEVCNRVVAEIENMDMPAEVCKEIAECVSKFHADTRFAVRSSALGEDSEDMSAAGQMTTLLGLQNKENVVSGVVKCWASQFSFTNVNYKRQYGQPLDVPMAVVVQELVDASAAGVMFTCDPLTGSPAHITVTANYGLGESVVSASAEPDTFVLKRAGVERPFIESVQLGHKSVCTTSSESGGVMTVPVSSEKANSACISSEDVETLAFIGTQIEKTYTTPQDIEWAISDGKFFMLQCRPVTTFLRESDCEMIHEFDSGLRSEKEVLSKANMSEVFPGATSPLSLTYMRVALDGYSRPFGVRLMVAFGPDTSQYVSPWMPLHRYNYFMWFSDGHQKTGPDATGLDKSLMYSVMGRDVSEELAAGVKRKRPLDKKKLPLQLYNTAKMMLTVKQGLEKVAAETEALELSVNEEMTAEEIYDYIGRSLPHLREPTAHLLKSFACSSLYNLIILQILGRANGELNSEVFSELSKILLGGDVESADVPRMIQELGAALRESPEKERFLNMTVDEASEWLSKTENECGVKFREFIKKHGHRAVKEAAARAPQVEKKSTYAAWDLSKLPYKLSLLQRLILKFVIPRARISVAARETSKSAMVRVLHQLRLVSRELARRMVCEGRLPSPDLIFFLTYEEIGLLLRTRAPELVLKAQRRQKIHAVVDKDKYPALFIGVPKPVERFKKYIEGDFEIKGNPMSQGVAEGLARVVPTFEEAHLIQKGEILITTATDTGWTPYFPLLAGVVTEIGGPLSHGAVVAREYGLPCVVGIDGITTMLANGDYIQLDGNTGVLRKIAAPVTEED